MRAEATDVIDVTAKTHERPLPVLADLQIGRVHRGAGHLAMQRMVILRTGATVAQQTGVIGETAIGLDDHLRGARLGKSAVHRQAHAVEHRVPEHLAHVRQHLDPAARGVHADHLDAKRGAPAGDGEPVGLGEHARGQPEPLTRERNDHAHLTLLSGGARN